jgi:tripartite-type tricarboxylate transporter receptor subunit TctC
MRRFLTNTAATAVQGALDEWPELADNPQWYLGNYSEVPTAEKPDLGPQLVATNFQKETGTRFVLIPYRGGALAFQDLMAGHIDLLFITPDLLSPALAASIKTYAVTSDSRLALAHDLPTFAELGLPAVSWSAWYALFAPKGTPRDIIGKLNAAVVDALADPSVRSRLVDLGFEIFPPEQQTPEALGAMQKAAADGRNHVQSRRCCHRIGLYALT